METPYLTAEYLEAMKVCVDEAKRNNLEVWLYDEHPFPAGCAGGLVGAENKANRHQVLVMLRHNRLTPIEEGLAYYEFDLDRGELKGLQKIRDPQNYKGKSANFLHFYTWTAPVQPAFHHGRTDIFIHGFPYTDVLNPAAVRRFIELTYEGYKQAVGKEFGKTVKGAFSDIPVYQWHYATPRPSIPWTKELPRIFKKRFGYDLIAQLPSLFFDVGSYSQVRQDFWQLVNSLFLNSYTVQLAEWCKRNKLKYTAHYWGEETLHWQIAWTGDVMTHFAEQHIVSIDHILRNIEDPLGVKQAASVAEQLGKPRLISETYALSGHNLTFEERKWIGDWEYALGVNCLVPYIPSYSMRGRRKRDEPPTEFFQQPYWKHEKLINDYYGRLSYLLTRGKRVVDILVLQPLNSARSLYKPSIEEPAAYRPHADRFEAAGVSLYQYSQRFNELCDELLKLHHDFHLGNEELLAKHARVKSGKLSVVQMSYSVVIVPPSDVWSKQTIKLLDEFVEQGGRVIDEKELDTALKRELVPDVEIDGAEHVLYQHRITDDEDIYFFANSSLSRSYLQTRISIKGEGALEVWNAFTDRRFALTSERVGERQIFQLDFHPAASFVVIRRRTGKQEKLPRLEPLRKDFSEMVKLKGTWQLERKNPNALTLDYCRLNIEDIGWTQRIPLWKAHRQLRQAGLGANFVSRFNFHVTDKPAKALLAIEQPERYTIKVNESVVITRHEQKWWDASIALFDIASLLERDDNVIEISGKVGMDLEFEPIYIVGDFALQQGKDFTLVKEPREVKAENLVLEGYPFYAGSFVLRRTFEIPSRSKRVYLDFDEVNAIIAQVRVNGAHVKDLCWKPYLVELTGSLKTGKNVLEIELCTSLHNLLGPHHQKQGEARHFVLEHSWADAVNWTDKYFFVPVGVKGVNLCYADKRPS